MHPEEQQNPRDTFLFGFRVGKGKSCFSYQRFALCMEFQKVLPPWKIKSLPKRLGLHVGAFSVQMFR